MTSELTEREYERMLNTITTASEWHGGQFSALYSYSSTGRIHSLEHREDLLIEIEACQRDYAHDQLTDLDLMALEHLRYTVECWPNEAV